MSSTSDVGIAFKRNLAEKIKENFIWLFDNADQKLEHNDGFLLIHRNVRWYNEDEVRELYGFLKAFDDSDFIIRDACHTYPMSDEMDIGNWHQNPFNFYKQLKAEIHYVSL